MSDETGSSFKPDGTCSTNNDSSNGLSHEYLRLPLAGEANAKSRDGSAVKPPVPQHPVSQAGSYRCTAISLARARILAVSCQACIRSNVSIRTSKAF